MTLPPRDGWPEHYEEAAAEAGHDSWAAWVAEVEARRGHPVCGRRNRAGRPCELPEAWGTGKPGGACKKHNGGSPAGVASHNWKHGGRSRAPTSAGSLRARVERFMQLDPRRTLHVGMATLMARLDDLLERLEEGGVGPDALAEARDLFREMGTTREPARMAELLREVQGIVESASNADEVWAEIYEVFSHLRSGAEVWRKIMADAGELVERSRVLILVDRLATDVATLLEEELPPDRVDDAKVRLAGIVATYLRVPLPTARASD